MPEVVLDAKSLVRRFPGPGAPTVSVDHVSLEVAAGEVVAVVGPSGSGKSSLIHLLAGLDDADAGSVRIVGREWGDIPEPQRAHFRRCTCGFVPQSYALLAAATAAENIEVPLVLEGMPTAQRRERVAGALAAVGLEPEADKLPDQLSGGQQQRVTVARALVLAPKVILADEPTAALDSETAVTVTELLVAQARRSQTAVLVVSHDMEVAARADRRIELVSGHIRRPQDD